jgi:mannitol-1-/sugar-/sorbitol-6-phosphatase
MAKHTLRCQGFLFDLDGVLVDSRAVVERTWRRWAHRHHIDPERFIRIAHGRRARDTLRDIDPRLATDAEVAWLDAAELTDVDGLRAVPGAKQLLSRLPPAAWGVVTSCNRGLAELRLDAGGLPRPAVFVVSEDVKVGKPAPDGYRLGAKRLGLDPSVCIVFEDAPAGIAAARAAGATVVGLTTSHAPGQLRAAGPPAALIPDLSDVRIIAATDAGFIIETP